MQSKLYPRLQSLFAPPSPFSCPYFVLWPQGSSRLRSPTCLSWLCLSWCWPRLLCTAHTAAPLSQLSTWQVQRVAPTEDLTLKLYAAVLRKHRFTRDLFRSCAHAEVCWANLWAFLMLLLKICIFLLLNIYALKHLDGTPWTCLSLKAKSKCLLFPWPPSGAIHDFFLCAPKVSLLHPLFWLLSSFIYFLPAIWGVYTAWPGTPRIAMVLYSVLRSAAMYGLGPLFIPVWTGMSNPIHPTNTSRVNEREERGISEVRCSSGATWWMWTCVLAVKGGQRLKQPGISETNSTWTWCLLHISEFGVFKRILCLHLRGILLYSWLFLKCLWFVIRVALPSWSELGSAPSLFQRICATIAIIYYLKEKVVRIHQWISLNLVFPSWEIFS